LFYIHSLSGWVFLFIKAALNKFYTKNTSDSAFNAISDKIYLGVNLNIGEALWIQIGAIVYPASVWRC